MAEKIEDLTIEYVEDGITTIKELEKAILSKGAWTTILYKLQNWNRTKQAYDPISFSIRRYQKRNGQYMQRSKFNFSSIDQTKKMIALLNQWIDEEEQASTE